MYPLSSKQARCARSRTTEAGISMMALTSSRESSSINFMTKTARSFASRPARAWRIRSANSLRRANPLSGCPTDACSVFRQYVGQPNGSAQINCAISERTGAPDKNGARPASAQIMSWLLVGLLTSAIWAPIASADEADLPRTLSFGMLGAILGGLTSAAAAGPGEHNIIALITSILGALIFLFIDTLIFHRRSREPPSPR